MLLSNDGARMALPRSKAEIIVFCLFVCLFVFCLAVHSLCFLFPILSLGGFSDPVRLFHGSGLSRFKNAHGKKKF